MKFGISITPGVGAPERVRRAEASGFDLAFFVDSPMLFGDPYVTIAACAVQTTTIALMPGVTNPITRTPQTTAAILAALNAFAPGRIAMGIGTGFTATGTMGLRSATLAQIERYVEAVRGLLRGEVVDIETNDATIPMQLLNPRLPFMSLADRIPVFLAASGPRALTLAGRIADGVVLGGIVDPDVIAACRDIVERGARAAGRDPAAIELAVTPRLYLTSEEGLSFEQTREILGPKVLGPAINLSRVAEASPRVPRSLAAAFVAARGAYRPDDAADGGDPRTRHLRAYLGYTDKLQAWQEPLVTREILEATTVVGTARQCAAKLHSLASAGVARVILSPASDQVDAVIDTFGREVIPQLAHVVHART